MKENGENLREYINGKDVGHVIASANNGADHEHNYTWQPPRDYDPQELFVGPKKYLLFKSLWKIFRKYIGNNINIFLWACRWQGSYYNRSYGKRHDAIMCCLEGLETARRAVKASTAQKQYTGPSAEALFAEGKAALQQLAMLHTKQQKVARKTRPSESKDTDIRS